MDSTRTSSDASRPTEFHKRDLKAVARRTKTEIKNDNLGLLAAGVSFYAFLSIIPALTALVSIYALFADPAQVEHQVEAAASVIPSDARSVIQSQLQRITQSSGGSLGLGAIAGILVAIWSANKATKGLFQALSIVYGEKEERSFFRMNGQSLLMTLGLLVAALVTIFLITVFPALVGALGLGSVAETLSTFARWPVLIGLVLIALATLYKFAPDRDQPQWLWASPGALLATALWLVASIGFSLYAQHFGSYNKTYGVLGAVIVLMLWLFISAYVVLIGGELNAELEHQTTHDTTRGPERPMGQRGAHVADTTPT
ncbi:MAG: YihY/virulence factor BrkB family protein [Kofleriaceae bacterium]|nr:YihY/virulence factor BrkB family protein [Kofleriaceae bacterium]